MLSKRTVERIYTPHEQPGFLGRGHTARSVVMGDFSQTDPFIMLMDDILDKKDDVPVGGPHPHAGFETVTLILEGELEGEGQKIHAGDFQIMTAGSGIIHTEIIDKPVKLRVLQMWLNLPKKDRWTSPRLQDLPLVHVPTLHENGVQIKLYSGAFAGLKSAVLNYVPLIVADISLDAGATTVQEVPACFNTFLYVIEGSVKAGENESQLDQDMVGWLNVSGDDTSSELRLAAGEKGARLILYSGLPTGDKIVSHGPFIADKPEEIHRLYQQYRMGEMQHITTVAASQKMLL